MILQWARSLHMSTVGSLLQPSYPPALCGLLKLPDIELTVEEGLQKLLCPPVYVRLKALYSDGVWELLEISGIFKFCQEAQQSRRVLTGKHFAVAF